MSVSKSADRNVRPKHSPDQMCQSRARSGCPRRSRAGLFVIAEHLIPELAKKERILTIAGARHLSG